MPLTGIEAVVLAGGLGTRLRPVLGERPKALAPVAGRLFLAYVLEELWRVGVRSAVLCTGFGADAVEQAIGDGSRFGLRVGYSREPSPLGTGGALRKALAVTGAGPLLVLNGDSLVDGGLQPLFEEHRRTSPLLTMLVARVEQRGRFGAVRVGGDGRVHGFESAGAGGPGWANAGAYVVERKVLEAIPPERQVSLESEVLPGLLPAVRAVPVGSFLVDIGTPESLTDAQQIFATERWQRGVGPGPSPSEERASRGGDSREGCCEHREWARASLLESAMTKQRIADACLDQILEVAERVSRCLTHGGKVMLCGNGGSAADSQHLAAELMNRLSGDRERGPLAALALTVDSSFLTSHANDYGYQTVFQRQVEGLGRPGDVLILLSTSGSSENVVRAALAARGRGIGTVAFTGGSGGRLRDEVDLAVVVPSRDPQRIQEGHIAIGHVLVGLVERLLFPEDGWVAGGAGRQK